MGALVGFMVFCNRYSFECVPSTSSYIVRSMLCHEVIEKEQNLKTSGHKMRFMTFVENFTKIFVFLKKKKKKIETH